MIGNAVSVVRIATGEIKDDPWADDLKDKAAEEIGTAAGVTDRLWEVAGIVKLLEAKETAQPKKRGS